MDRPVDQDEAEARLAARLGHAFRDPRRLRDALTHRSYANEHPDHAPVDNERMELLGDAVLGLAACALLFERFGDAREGELSRRRADLVCEPALAAIAQELGVGDALRLGKGEARSGGSSKPRLLASALEAIIAAVYLDADPTRALSIGRALLEPRLDSVEPGGQDFKSQLQMRVQTGGAPPPTYELVGEEGPHHDRLFHVAVIIGGDEVARGTGRSKSAAEQAAAEAALGTLDPPTSG
ncbi:MAG: ribonuclease III [Sandaracinaceae bacterium]